jgi:hypothetical protein
VYNENVDEIRIEVMQTHGVDIFLTLEINNFLSFLLHDDEDFLFNHKTTQTTFSNFRSVSNAEEGTHRAVESMRITKHFIHFYHIFI